VAVISLVEVMKNTGKEQILLMIGNVPIRT
jgi:hypothetical protein